jgi:hypothetical protein
VDSDKVKTDFMSKSIALLLFFAFVLVIADIARATSTVTISILPPDHIVEGAGNFIFVLRRSGDLPSTKVLYKVSGTATSGSDFTAPSGSAAFASGQDTANVSIPTLDDLQAEADETVTVTVIPPVVGTSYVVGSPAAATGTITDNEPTITITTDNGTIAQEVSATTLTVGPDFRIDSTGSANSITVKLAISGTATNGTDYTTISPSVDVGGAALGGAPTKGGGGGGVGIPLTVKDDLVVDPDETVTLKIVQSGGYHVGIPNTATITIKDNDPPTISLTVKTATAQEKGQTPAVVTVVRTGDLQQDLDVGYQVNPAGTSAFPLATSGTDFQPLSGTVKIPANTNGADIVITPIDDNEVEPTEKVEIKLGPPGINYQVGSTTSATISIVSDDLPFVNIEATDGIASEAGPDTGSFHISRTGSTANNLIVSFTLPTTASNVAVRGTDYTLSVRILGNTVTIPAGSSGIDVVITPIDDAVAESQEQVIMSIAPSASYTVGASATATIFISDND